jgi:transcriptional regulator with XRE-family HTH domain
MTSTEETARRIRSARAYAGLTQEDMAERLGISTVTYKRVEQAKRPVELRELARISEITQMPTNFFSVDLTALDDGAAQKEQMEAVQERIQSLVGRLEDIEYRMRQNAKP